MTKKISLKHIWSLFFLVCAIAVLTIFSKELGQGVRKGISLCGELVVPSLFVFLCFSEWMCYSENVQKVSFLLQPMFRLIFGKEFQGGVPLLLCLIGGYPMGASALSILYKRGSISYAQVKNWSLWIFSPSPAFVITGVGKGMLGSLKIGTLLWCACVVSCLLTGVIICRFPLRQNNQMRQTSGNNFSVNTTVNAVSSATEKMLIICGTVILVAGILSAVNGLQIPGFAKRATHLFLEVTNGCTYLLEKGGSLPEFVAVLMFGGIGTHLQCRMLLGGAFPAYKVYVVVRFCQAFLAYGFVALFCLCFPQTIQTMSLGTAPTMGTVSVLPSVGLLATCFVFLCSLHQKPLFRRNHCEKSRLCS